MSRTFRFTTSDEVGAEIEQYLYAKHGTTPAKALESVVLAQMSKNPFTVQQSYRVARKYREATIVSPEVLALALKEVLAKGSS